MPVIIAYQLMSCSYISNAAASKGEGNNAIVSLYAIDCGPRQQTNVP